MQCFWILLGILVGGFILVFLTSLICFFRVFYSPTRVPLGEDEYDIPDGAEYEAHRESIKAWIDMSRTLPHQNFSITSHDGLTLRGRYYECQPGGPIEILFHGYRGNSERDMSGGIERCFAMGRNALIVDHRAAGKSDGHVITFGICERKDCLKWMCVSFVNETLPKGKQVSGTTKLFNC